MEIKTLITPASSRQLESWRYVTRHNSVTTNQHIQPLKICLNTSTSGTYLLLLGPYAAAHRCHYSKAGVTKATFGTIVSDQKGICVTINNALPAVDSLFSDDAATKGGAVDNRIVRPTLQQCLCRVWGTGKAPTTTLELNGL